MQAIVLTKNKSITYRTTLVFLSSLFIGLCAQLCIPLHPIPITMQTFAVLLVTMTLGWRLGTLSILAYLAEGAIGLPVFANFHAGLAVMYGPTSGYLYGFVLAALVSGYLLEKGFARYHITTFLAALLGFVIIFAMGIAVLSQFVGYRMAIHLGLKPFMFIGTIKLLLLTSIIPLFWRNPDELHTSEQA